MLYINIMIIDSYIRLFTQIYNIIYIYMYIVTLQL
jgi:hypothetical protein